MSSAFRLQGMDHNHGSIHGKNRCRYRLNISIFNLTSHWHSRWKTLTPGDKVGGISYCFITWATNIQHKYSVALLMCRLQNGTYSMISAWSILFSPWCQKEKCIYKEKGCFLVICRTVIHQESLPTFFLASVFCTMFQETALFDTLNTSISLSFFGIKQAKNPLAVYLMLFVSYFL